MAIKNCLLDYRFKLKFKTQKQMAKYLGVDKGTYCNWENNRYQPSIDQLFDIADKLEVQITDIIYRDNEPEIKNIKPKEVKVSNNDKSKNKVPKRITSYSF